MTKISRNKSLQIFLGMGLLLATGLPAMASETANKDEWQFDATVYLWAAEIKADLPDGGDIDISFNDIMKNLEMAFMGTFGARKDKLRVFVDAIYMDLKDDSVATIFVPEKVDIGIELKARIAQPSVAYSVYQQPDYNIDIIGGARYLWIEVEPDLDVVGGPTLSGKESGSNWDGIVGLQGNISLSKDWGAVLYGDYGTGDSDYTYQALAGLNYQFESVAAVFGYRHMRWEFKNDVPLDNLRISGPYAGVTFKF
jgi:hypothetical protein